MPTCPTCPSCLTALASLVALASLGQVRQVGKWASEASRPTGTRGQLGKCGKWGKCSKWASVSNWAGKNSVSGVLGFSFVCGRQHEHLYWKLGYRGRARLSPGPWPSTQGDFPLSSGRLGPWGHGSIWAPVLSSRWEEARLQTTELNLRNFEVFKAYVFQTLKYGGITIR